MKHHHDGIIVYSSMMEEIELYKKLGYEIESDIFVDELQKIKGIFLINQNHRVELLEPLNETSPIISFKKRNFKIYHHCFECDDIAKTVEKLNGIVVSSYSNSTYFKDSIVSFVLLNNNLLIELVQVFK